MVLFLLFCKARRRRLGMSEQSDEIPVRDWLYSVVLVYIKKGAAYAYLLARALPAGTRDVGAKRRNPL